MSGEGLHGRTALVTGAAKRVGRAIALALAGDGANVVIHYNESGKEAAGFREELASLGVDAWTVQADFSKPDEYGSLIDRAIGLAGKIDILVNSASIFSSGKFEEMTKGELEKNIEINAWVPFILGRDIAKKSDRGAIVNILDTRISGFDLKHPAYILSKKMLYEMTRMMAVEFAPGITVNGVAPGLILPPSGKDEKYLDKLAANIPLKRHGNPRDIADAVIFLVRSDFITGQVIYVDGGRHLRERIHGQDTDS